MKCITIKIIMAVSLILMVVSLIKIIDINHDNSVTKESIRKINSIINADTPNKKDIYDMDFWDDILNDVDISELKSINESVIGWIKVDGTNINYPFVQSNDNKYYLSHSFDKSKTTAGWIFLDYRNNFIEMDKNTIIYAHARKDKSMFGSLRNTLTNKWLKDENMHTVKIITDTKKSYWQVFSVYHIPTTSDYIKIKFKDIGEYSQFLDKIKKRSIKKFNVALDENDNILTLSTCYGKKEKLVLHAKLIKEEV